MQNDFSILVLFLLLQVKCILFKKNFMLVEGRCRMVAFNSRGSKGKFEYTINDKKYWEYEARSHWVTLEKDKEYIIYVNRKKIEKCISKKAVKELVIFLDICIGVPCVFNAVLMLL